MAFIALHRELVFGWLAESPQCVQIVHVFDVLQSQFALHFVYTRGYIRFQAGKVNRIIGGRIIGGKIFGVRDISRNIGTYETKRN